MLLRKPIFCLFLLASNINVSAEAKSLIKIAFGSCAYQDRKEQMWATIANEKPDLFGMLGDNIYGDTENMAELEKKYSVLGAQTDFQNLRKNTKILATWDDHDYGLNDSGGDYRWKNESRKIMLDFFEEPKNSVLRTQEGGIYRSYVYERFKRKVHIVLLDSRWNRSPLKYLTDQKEIAKNQLKQRGKNTVSKDKNSTILGVQQWLWLEKELQKTSDILVLASSIQVLADESGFESWSNFPHERERLLKMLEKYRSKSKISFIISGDIHRAEFDKIELGSDKTPLWEFISSGLTHAGTYLPDNQYRVSVFRKPNYGVIEIADAPGLEVSVKIKDREAKIQIEQTLKLASAK